MSENLANALYLLHALVTWGGGIRELYHILKCRSARDVKLSWISCLVFAEFLALPRAFSSCYWVWMLCHVVATILLIILWVAVFKYGRIK